METQSSNLKNSGVRLAKIMLKNKALMQEEALLEYQSNPLIKVAVEKLKNRSAQRGTPIIGSSR